MTHVMYLYYVLFSWFKNMETYQSLLDYDNGSKNQYKKKSTHQTFLSVVILKVMYDLKNP